MTLRSVVAIVGVIIHSAFLLPGTAFGSSFTLASVSVSFDAISNFAASGSSTASLDKTAVSRLSDASASAFAGAEVGHLRAYIDGGTESFSGGLTDNLGQSITARPRSTPRFSDNMTVTATGLAQNALVTVNALLVFDGFLSTTATAGGLTPIGDSRGASQITVQLVGTGLPTDFHLAPFGGAVAAGAKAEQNYPTGPSVSVNVEIPTIIPVTFTAHVGALTPIQYLMDMQGFAQSSVFRNSAANLFGSSEILGNYSNSLSWGGITSVTDSAGNLISDFTALGDDGFNYRNAFAPTATEVPEPASFVLLLSGGLATLARRRRRAGCPDAASKSLAQQQSAAAAALT